MSLARDVTTVGSATLLSRLIGFFRDVGIAAVLGAGVLSDAFFAALQIPNLFRRLLAEGALNSAFVPMWLRVKAEGGERAACSFGESVLGIMTVSLGLIALLCIAVRADRGARDRTGLQQSGRAVSPRGRIRAAVGAVCGGRRSRLDRGRGAQCRGTRRRRRLRARHLQRGDDRGGAAGAAVGHRR